MIGADEIPCPGPDVMVGAYPFLGARCARITEAVRKRMG
jgi:hypothetical protein